MHSNLSDSHYHLIAIANANIFIDFHGFEELARVVKQISSNSVVPVLVTGFSPGFTEGIGARP